MSEKAIFDKTNVVNWCLRVKGMKARGCLASGSQSLQLGEKDDHIMHARCASVSAKASKRKAAQSRTASGIYDKRVPSFSIAVDGA
jgi:hypothetical protein